MKQQFTLPKEIELPPINIPIINHKGKKIGIAVQVKRKDNKFTFQPTFKAGFERKYFEYKFSYEPYIESGKLKSINLSLIMRM
jgi:hypothetical protein